MSYLTCSLCGISDEHVAPNWWRAEDNADAPVYVCGYVARDRCTDRQLEQKGQPPFLVTCPVCGERIPRASAVLHHEHVGGIGTVARYYCGTGVGHRREEVRAGS